jgi:inner membrane protein
MNSIATASFKTWISTWFITFNAITLSIYLNGGGEDGWLIAVWLVIGIGVFFLTIPAFILLLIFNHFAQKKQIHYSLYLLLQAMLVVVYLSLFWFLLEEVSKSYIWLPYLGGIVGNLYANMRMYHRCTHPVFSKHYSFFQFNNMETNPNNLLGENAPNTDQKPNSYGFKLLILGVMALILFLGTFLVRSLISERQDHRSSAVHFFESSWGKEQTISGPFLSIPYRVRNTEGKTFIQYAYVMPKTLKLDCEIAAEQRRKGIYKVQLYKAHQTYEGSFDLSELNNISLPSNDFLWEKASICFGFSDPSAFDKLDQLKVNGQSMELAPGLPSEDVMENGFSANIALQGISTLSFQAKMSVRGTERISFIPVGKTTDISVRSNWASPDFFGKNIPEKKPETSANGFSGNWKLQHLNRSFPQSWTGKAYEIQEDAVGVGLMNPVDNYVQSERIVKYALLVIGLVFTIFFFMEMLNGRTIHPLQYLLVGFALSLFYSLMVALSEHLAFVAAYWIAAGMTILLIALYLKSVLGQLKLALFSGLSITAIYGFMYMLLLQEDYALLIGNIGLFVVLAMVMYFSRKVQWGKV